MVVFPSLDADGEEFRDMLYMAFPELRDGGRFEFCKCIGNSTTLQVLSTSVHASLSLFKERVGSTKTYIRPLQCDLDMSILMELPMGVCTLYTTLIWKCILIKV